MYQFNLINISHPNDGHGNTLYETGRLINENFLLIEGFINTISEGGIGGGPYAALHGDFEESFSANYFNTKIGLSIGDPTETIVSRFTSDISDIDSLGIGNAHSLKITHELTEKSSGLILGYIDPTDPSLSAILGIAHSEDNIDWEFLFRITNDGSLYLKNKLIIDSDGILATSPPAVDSYTKLETDQKLFNLRNDLVNNAPEELDTIGELAEAIANPSGGNNLTGLPWIRFNYPVAAMSWTVKHDQSSTIFLETIRDSQGRKVIGGITIIDGNEFRVDFNEPVAGTVDMVFGNANNVPNSMQRFNFPTPNIKWTIVHNRNTDRLQERVRPTGLGGVLAEVVIIDLNTFEVSFTEPTSGFVDILFGN